MATIFQGGKVIGRTPIGMAAAGRPVLEMMERARRRAGMLDEEEEPDGEYEPLFPSGRPLKGSGTPVGEEIPRLGSESQQDELQERRDRLEEGMANTRAAISGDTSLMGPTGPSQDSIQRFNSILSNIRPRTVPESIIDTGNSIARNMLGQPEVDRQLSAKFGNIARATTDSFMESQSEVLDIPFEEESDDFGFDALEDESMFASSPTSDLDYDFSIA